MKTLIAGCGYLGRALAQDLLAQKHEVWGLRRDTNALKDLIPVGLKPVAASLLNPESLKNLPAVECVVICQAPSREMDNYRDTYFEGTKNLLGMLKPKDLKVIFISSTSVYGGRDGAWVDESTNPLEGDFGSQEIKDNANCLLDTEQVVLKSRFPSIVLRLAGIYGPSRNRLKVIREGTLKPDFSDIYTNRIHVEDAVRGIRLLIDKGIPEQIYLGVDDNPCTQNEFYSWIYRELGMERPLDVKDESILAKHRTNKKCSNKKIKDLGMKFKYPSHKEGYEPWISQFCPP